MPLPPQRRFGEPSVPNEVSQREFISALLDVTGEDARRVTVVSTFALALVAFLVKEAQLETEAAWVQVVAAIGFALLLGGSLALWTYAARVNFTRMRIAQCMSSSDAKGAYELWAGGAAGVDRKYGWLFNAGAGLLALGLGAAAVAFVEAMILG